MYDQATSFFDDGYALVGGVNDDGDSYKIIINKNKEIAKFDNIKTGFNTKLHGDPDAIVEEDEDNEEETTTSNTTSATTSEVTTSRKN